MKTEGEQVGTIITPPETKDFPQMMEIERSSFDVPWTESEFVRVLFTRNISCVLLKSTSLFRQDSVLGYVFYCTERKRLDIWNLAVRLDRRRRGHGTRLIAYLKERAERGTRKTLEAVISEQNLVGHLFFHAGGFRATEVLRDHYGEDHDAYRMVWDSMPFYRNRLFGGRRATNFLDSTGGAATGEGVG